MKYRLIKEYPGSPNIGTIHSDSKSTEWLGLNVYEKHQEYWSKIEEQLSIITEDGVEMYNGDLHWVVLNQSMFETSSIMWYFGTIKRFSTKELASEYLYNKVKVLTYDEIMFVFTELISKREFSDGLKKLIISKL